MKSNNINEISAKDYRICYCSKVNNKFTYCTEKLWAINQLSDDYSVTVYKAYKKNLYSDEYLWSSND